MSDLKINGKLMRHLLASLLFISTVHAEPWDATEKFLGTAMVAAIVTDCGQARYAVHHSDQFKENNLILGEHPSLGRVNAYFSTYIVGSLLVANWLTPYNRKLFLGTVTAVELIVINHNRSIGVKIAF